MKKKLAQAQFNPSTLKAMYNSVSGKQAEARYLCNNGQCVVPKYIYITFSDIEGCGCQLGPLGNFYYKLIGDWQALINDRPTVGHELVLDTSRSDVCRWGKTINTEENEIGIEVYSEAGCAGEPEEHNIDYLEIRLWLTGGWLTIRVLANCPTLYQTQLKLLFSAQNAVAIEACQYESELPISNDITVCALDAFPLSWKMGHNGQVNWTPECA